MRPAGESSRFVAVLFGFFFALHANLSLSADAAKTPAAGRDRLAADGSWRDLTPGDTGPARRWGHAAIYDPIRDRIVLFGGHDLGPLLGDVWVLDLALEPRWNPLEVSGLGPSAREGHSAIYDPVGDRMLVHGGDDGSLHNDVWALNLGGNPTWTLLAPTGQLPPDKSHHTAIYDSKRRAMVVFGGATSANFGSNDTWVLSLDSAPAWTRLTVPGTLPGIRRGHTAIHDPLRDRMLMFGGENGFRDTWILTLGENPLWTKFFPIRVAPGSWTFHHSIYDPATDRWLVYGGTNRDDVWELPLSTNPENWVEVPTTSPIPLGRSRSTMVHDTLRNRLVVFGGTSTWDPANPLGDLWTLSLNEPVLQWETLQLGPPVRMHHTAVYDPIRERMLVFGGRDENGVLAELWSLDLTPVPLWTKLAATGTPPPARDEHVAIYEPAGDRMLVFGGANPFRNDVWALSLANDSWQEVLPTGTPPAPRSSATAIYDSDSARLILFGGWNGSAFHSDTWVLDTTPGVEAWNQIFPAGNAPAARMRHTAIHDPFRDEMLVFGGLTTTGISNDVWRLTLGVAPTWVSPAVSSTRPHVSWGHAAILEPIAHRMIVFGTFNYETWELDLTVNPLAWRLLAPAGIPSTAGRFAASATYDPGRAQMVIHGGQDATSQVRNSTWAWATNAATDISFEPSLPSVVFPNPFLERTTIRFALPASTVVRITVHDVAGRLVRTLRDGTLSPGAHEVAWDGADTARRHLPRGIYFIQLDAAGSTQARKVMLRR